MRKAFKLVLDFDDYFIRLRNYYDLVENRESASNNYGGCLVHMALQFGVGLKTRIAKEWTINWSKH
ncbi:hypothetical protein [Aureibacter tunicatorum]|uniref:Uncharacterized protein n=1 Tax=Aureibacter tunicatorum TaxID=866807 RepID=A0AAE3XMQ4_9BACT|nr:hypothetical protein [Aureibacter tunicatorum]MDR6238808.1 hypothetical protein [Aureibacter tunicatorum]